MASLAVMAGGALVNTLAFSVTNFIFGQLEDHGTREIKRHNLAVERLSKAKEEYTKEHQQRLDYLDKTSENRDVLSKPLETLSPCKNITK